MTSWALEYLELATHHGSVSASHDLVVLPGESDRYLRPSPIWVGIASFVVFVLIAYPVRGPWPAGARTAYTIFAGALTVLLIAIQCSQWFTPFRVVVAADRLSIWLAALLAPRVWPAIRWLGQIEKARAAVVALLVFAMYGVLMRTRLRDSYRGNYSGMLLVSEALFDGNPLLAKRDDIRKTLVFGPDGGYDAQFMYFAAFDPLLRAFKDQPAKYRQVMDDAPYRFGRIGFSWLTLVFSAGRWERYPATMVWLVLCSLGLAAFVLSLMAQQQGLSAALGGLVAAIPGFWWSLQSGLPEPIAAATLLAGLFLLSRGKPWLAGGLFALSLLIRETGLVIVVCTFVAAMDAGGRQRRREALIAALLSGAVLLAWRIYVASILFPDGRLQTFLFNASNFSWPFAGIRDLWRLNASGQYFPSAPEVSRAATTLSLMLIGGVALALVLARTRPGATSAAALIYALGAVCLNYPKVWVFVGNTERVTYELFLALALSCLAIRECSRPLRAGLIAFWSFSVVYVLFLTFDAAYIRSALSIPF